MFEKRGKEKPSYNSWGGGHNGWEQRGEAVGETGMGGRDWTGQRDPVVKVLTGPGGVF